MSEFEYFTNDKKARWLGLLIGKCFPVTRETEGNHV
jgi:hypothetical protein